jgi:hypothetical protein
LKRTLTVRLAIGAPLAVVLLNFVLYAQRRAGAAGDNALLGFAQINFTMWTILVLPLYIALVAALMAAVDHQTDGWKQLFVLPISRASVFAAKWIASAGIVLASTIVFAAAISTAAEILRLIRPAFSSATVPVALIVLRSFQTFAAACLIVSIQTWISLRYRTFIAGLGLGIVAVLVLLGGVARSGLGTVVIYTYPWALPPTVMARMWETHPDRWLVAGGGIAAGALVAAAGCWNLSRRDFI